MKTLESQNSKKLSAQFNLFECIDKVVPGIFIVLDIHKFTVKYMGKKALEAINKNMQQALAMTTEEIKTLLHPGLSEEIYEVLAQSVQNKNQEFAFFLKARYTCNNEYEWFHATFKPDYDKGLIYTIIQPVSKNLEQIPDMLKRFLDHNFKYLHEDVAKNKLTNKEKQVLSRVLLGQTSANIAADMNIAKNTVDNHRKNIIKKLQIKSLDELRNMTNII